MFLLLLLLFSRSPAPSREISRQESRRNGLMYRYTVYKDHVSLRDYEINDGMSLEMY
jgi:hypothetical protein